MNSRINKQPLKLSMMQLDITRESILKENDFK